MYAIHATSLLLRITTTTTLATAQSMASHRTMAHAQVTVPEALHTVQVRTTATVLTTQAHVLTTAAQEVLIASNL